MLVAIVDDKGVVLRLLKNILIEYFDYSDCEIALFTDPFDALASILKNKPKLIFLYRVMPKMKGDELLKYIRITDSYDPIIVLMSAQHEGLYDGIHYYMGKKLRYELLDELFKAISEKRHEHFSSGICQESCHFY